ncbi:hypothetical protein CMV_011175 [Castanea mollissima]|uniref:Uncharacterized protein n=1 Tax=Castanea mollissima TaxID=60419 RepID=A0A8J4VX50_9ROSI|nr:hypothetical protein CMV_011175 [Castanea mollissima]
MRTRRICTLLGIDSGIDGATSDSNFSSIQLSVLDENELNNCINRGLEHWFQSYFQCTSIQLSFLTIQLQKFLMAFLVL